jgi:hypothetical protein
MISRGTLRMSTVARIHFGRAGSYCLHIGAGTTRGKPEDSWKALPPPSLPEWRWREAVDSLFAVYRDCQSAMHPTCRGRTSWRIDLDQRRHDRVNRHCRQE